MVAGALAGAGAGAVGTSPGAGAGDAFACLGERSDSKSATTATTAGIAGAPHTAPHRAQAADDKATVNDAAIRVDLHALVQLAQAPRSVVDSYISGDDEAMAEARKAASTAKLSRECAEELKPLIAAVTHPGCRVFARAGSVEVLVAGVPRATLDLITCDLARNLVLKVAGEELVRHQRLPACPQPKLLSSALVWTDLLPPLPAAETDAALPWVGPHMETLVSVWCMPAGASRALKSHLHNTVSRLRHVMGKVRTTCSFCCGGCGASAHRLTACPCCPTQMHRFLIFTWRQGSKYAINPARWTAKGRSVPLVNKWAAEYAIPAATKGLKDTSSTVESKSPTSFCLRQDSSKALWMFFVCWDDDFHKTFDPVAARALECRLPAGASLESRSFRIPAHPEAVEIMRRESLWVVVLCAWLFTTIPHVPLT